MSRQMEQHGHEPGIKRRRKHEGLTRAQGDWDGALELGIRDSAAVLHSGLWATCRKATFT